MLEILKTASLEEIFRFGVYLFLLYMVYWFIKKMWGLLEGRIANIDNNVLKNKKINKDIAVIIAQTSKTLKEHDSRSANTQIEIVAGINKLTDNLNGGNPVVLKLREDFEEFKKKAKK